MDFTVFNHSALIRVMPKYAINLKRWELHDLFRESQLRLIKYRWLVHIVPHIVILIGFVL